MAGGETLLIDTTGGTVLLRQLREAGIALDSIRHLFVSHRHFDHAGGLAPLLVACTSLPRVALTIYALPETFRALHEILALTIPGVEGWLGPRLRWHELAPGDAVGTGDATVTPVPVEHGLECTGFRFVPGGKAVFFTADTRPCAAVVAGARGVDLLIHEAYGLEAGAGDAHRFGHSTAADAGRAAREAGAGRLLLTHLRAARFVDPAALAAEAAAVYGRPVEVAHDLDGVEL